MDSLIKNYLAKNIDYTVNHRTEIIQLRMLEMIDERETGLGAWEMASILLQDGFDISTATIGRYLKGLDLQGYTVKNGNKGRVITKEGKKFLETETQNLTSTVLHKNIQNATQTASQNAEYLDLYNIYIVRIALETEAVRLCCKHANEQQIEQIGNYAKDYIERANNKHDFTDVSLDFHILIAQATQNVFMENLLRMLIFEQKRIEDTLLYLETRENGLEYAEQHMAIYECIKNRDEEKAEKLMREHFDVILQDLKQGIDMHSAKE